MGKKYFTLFIRHDGMWSPEFGDYDRDVVYQERCDYLDSSDGIKAKDMKIVSHDDGIDQRDLAADLNRKVAA